MNVQSLPRIVTVAEIDKLASPTETHAVRVIARRIPSGVPYTLHGKSRKYILPRNNHINAHCIDVPASVWMAGVPAGPYVDNLSISHDMMSNRNHLKAPLVIQIVPWKGAQQDIPKAENAQPLAALRALAETFGAPEPILSAIDLVASPLNPADVELQLRDIRAHAEEEFARLETVAAIEAERLEQAPEPPSAASTTVEAPTTTPQSEESHSASPPSTPAPKAKSANAERQARHRAKKKAEREAKKNQA